MITFKSAFLGLALASVCLVSSAQTLDLREGIGGAIGGALGSKFGKGNGQTAATIVGTMIGQEVARGTRNTQQQPYQNRSSVTGYQQSYQQPYQQTSQYQSNMRGDEMQYEQRPPVPQIVYEKYYYTVQSTSGKTLTMVGCAAYDPNERAFRPVADMSRCNQNQTPNF